MRSTISRGIDEDKRNTYLSLKDLNSIRNLLRTQKPISPFIHHLQASSLYKTGIQSTNQRSALRPQLIPDMSSRRYINYEFDNESSFIGEAEAQDRHQIITSGPVPAPPPNQSQNVASEALESFNEYYRYNNSQPTPLAPSLIHTQPRTTNINNIRDTGNPGDDEFWAFFNLPRSPLELGVAPHVAIQEPETSQLATGPSFAPRTGLRIRQTVSEEPTLGSHLAPPSTAQDQPSGHINRSASTTPSRTPARRARRNVIPPNGQRSRIYCPHRGCSRSEGQERDHPFTRLDNLLPHRRQVHGDIIPKRRAGRRRSNETL